MKAIVTIPGHRNGSEVDVALNLDEDAKILTVTVPGAAPRQHAASFDLDAAELLHALDYLGAKSIPKPPDVADLLAEVATGGQSTRSAFAGLSNKA